jgi:hypothetical protein
LQLEVSAGPHRPAYTTAPIRWPPPTLRSDAARRTTFRIASQQAPMEGAISQVIS